MFFLTILYNHQSLLVHVFPLSHLVSIVNLNTFAQLISDQNILAFVLYVLPVSLPDNILIFIDSISVWCGIGVGKTFTDLDVL